MSETVDREIENLPPLPVLLLQALEVFDDPEFEYTRLERVVSKDQSLVSHILKIANSPFYGLSGKISSLKEAFIILGTYTMRNLVLSAGIMRALAGGDGSTGLSHVGLWQHAYGVATLARRTALRVKAADEEAAFVAGLLHDIGKVFMNVCYPADIQRILRLRLRDDCLYIQAEGAAGGFDHVFIGERLAEKWRLSPDVIEAIAYHHQPEATDNPVAHIVHLADVMCRALGFGEPGDDLVPPMYAGSLEMLGLSMRDLEAIMEESYPMMYSAAELLSEVLP